MVGTDSDPLPLTVVGGYLGAGKTTLVNRILGSPGGRRYGVIVNDVGEVNIDASLIEAVDGDTVTLSNGCVCCSLADGFAAALAELRAPARSIEHVVVEVSGVGDPRTVAQWGRTPGFALDAVVVLADATTVRDRAEDRYVGETVVGQLAGADLILLTHLDTVDDPDVVAQESGEWLAGITPAPILTDPAVALDLVHDPAVAFDLASDPATHSTRDANHLDHFVAVVDAIGGRTRTGWMQWLGAAPDGVVRIKGFAEIGADDDTVEGTTTGLRSAAARGTPDPELVSIQLAGRRAEVVRWKGRTDVPRRLVIIATHESPALHDWTAAAR